MRLVAIYVGALVFGVLGFVAGWSAWHLYEDHRLIDAIRADIVQRQRVAPQVAAP